MRTTHDRVWIYVIRLQNSKTEHCQSYKMYNIQMCRGLTCNNASLFAWNCKLKGREKVVRCVTMTTISFFRYNMYMETNSNVLRIENWELVTVWMQSHNSLLWIYFDAMSFINGLCAIGIWAMVMDLCMDSTGKKKPNQTKREYALMICIQVHYNSSECGTHEKCHHLTFYKIFSFCTHTNTHSETAWVETT